MWADAAAAHSSVSTWVPAEPATCFDYVADFSRHDEWATNPVKITALDGDGSGLGARYRAVGHQGGKDWPSELEVTVYNRPLIFEFTAKDGGTRIVLDRRDSFPPTGHASSGHSRQQLHCSL